MSDCIHIRKHLFSQDLPNLVIKKWECFSKINISFREVELSLVLWLGWKAKRKYARLTR